VSFSSGWIVTETREEKKIKLDLYGLSILVDG
jgi:hypothetical protein